MIIITGLLFLFTLPFFIYWCGKETPLKKYLVIVLEVIAIGALIFSSVLVALDIPYIIEGGQLYEGEPLCVTHKRVAVTIENSEDAYWFEEGIMFDDVAGGDVYVLPHTHLVYRIQTNDLIHILTNNNEYNAMNPGSLSVFLFVCIIAMWGYVIKSWIKWD